MDREGDTEQTQLSFEEKMGSRLAMFQPQSVNLLELSGQRHTAKKTSLGFTISDTLDNNEGPCFFHEDNANKNIDF